jgi:hypothetical protein
MVKDDIKTIYWEKSGPGKFEGGTDLNKYLYKLTMDSAQDEDLGDVEGFGWYGLFNGVGVRDGETGEIVTIYAIVSEDNQGFFDVYEYDTEKELMEAWEELQDEYEKWEESGEEE